MQRSGLHLILAAIAASLFLFVFPRAAWSQDQGATIFKERCAICHGVNGSGKTKAAVKMPMPDLRSAEVQKRTDDQLYESIALGKDHNLYPHTYLYKGVTEAQVHTLVRHLRQLADQKHSTAPNK